MALSLSRDVDTGPIAAANAAEIVQGFQQALATGDFASARKHLHDNLSFRGPIDMFDKLELYVEALKNYKLFVIDLRSRRVHVADSTPTPNAWFMAQAARRLTDAVNGFLAGHRVLICDRDAKWTDGLRRIVQGAGVRIVLTPVETPNANAYAERFVRSIRAECLDSLIPFGERRLLRALDEFVAHNHGERNHQGLGNELITPKTHAAHGTRVRCRERLGGLLRYYHRAA